MYCKKCGSEMNDDALFCSKCGEKFIKEEIPAVTAEPVENASGYAEEAAVPAEGVKEKFIKAPTKSGKSYAVIFTALTLLPAIFVLMIDYVANLAIDWPATKYVVGALVVVWICSVLPVLRITPAPVTAIICFASVTMYAMFVIKEINGSMEWFTVFALPLIMILAVFIGLDSALAANRVATAIMPGIVAGEAAIYSFIFGILWSHYYDDAVYMPRISVVFACGFLMLAVILAAMGYVKMINSKK
ncbi:MAG: zinc ribbon domain-containing protein [Clostridia bacterium]|nr:zinc ribbon domain-containing protein [Clostridia bacterium]